MLVKILALEVYETQNGVERLADVVPLGDADDYDKETGVTYEGTTDMDEIKEVMKGWGEASRMQYLGRAAEKGNIYIQCEANHLPRKIGATRVEIVTKEVEWE